MVTLITTTAVLKQRRSSETSSVGFVPTMGNLHQGHISLLKEALKNDDVVYLSIFVNPKQFGPNEDFNRYPRTLENDINLINEAAVDFPNSQVFVYAPTDPQEVFPAGMDQTISVQGLGDILEGKIRPGHFDGVATVVWRLFDLVKPQRAYFGLKDFQQYHVIRQMVKDLALPIKIQGMPIVREKTGLALSSRNQYLTSEQKEASLILFRTLSTIKELIISGKSPQDYMRDALKDPNWNYLVLRDTETFSEDITNSKNISILAVYQMGNTRLLDNMQVEVL